MLLNENYGYADVTIRKNVKIYAYGNVYSDMAGTSGKDLIIKKYNGTTYEDYMSVPTYNNGKKYELVTLEKGKYRLMQKSYYTSFDELEYEVIE